MALVACGGDDRSVRTEATEAASIFDASPGADALGGPSGLPDDAVVERIELSDGGIDPEIIEARVGFPVILTVEGDGDPHTMEIGDYVGETEIEAEGETLIQFTVPEDTEGEVAILLDGEEVGRFRAQAAGGLTN